MTKQIVFPIWGMTCANCEKRVLDAAKRLQGVSGVHASFARRCAVVSFDPERTDEAAVKAAIEAAGYRVPGAARERQPLGKVAPVVLIVSALYFILRHTVGFDFISYIPKIDSTVSLAALLITGLLTSVHCVAMCGGINLSQSVGAGGGKSGGIKSPLLYNLGRVISYTAIGAIVGGLGSMLFLSQTVKAVILVIAAAGMLLMGLSMLGWLPWWLVPRLPAALAKKADRAKTGEGPFIVGLLNGLMPCGPLQAMQLYALASGSALTGALAMLLFSLGTVPLMLGAGVLFSSLKAKSAHTIARISAVLILCFAVIMAANAASLLGAAPAKTPSAASAGTNAKQDASAEDESVALIRKALDRGYVAAKVDDGVQKVEAELSPGRYPYIIVQKDVPVEFTISADESAITGCNQSLVFPAYGVEQALEPGDNVISFTPDQSGLISYTCWMGMLQGRILVVDRLDPSGAA